MKILNLIRHTYHPEATMGEIKIGAYSFQTIEKPWKNNEAWNSCIPEGVYTCSPYSSDKYPNVYEITDVPDRTHILFHKGNYSKNVSGCIAIGTGVNGLMVTDSVDAMDSFRRLLGSDDFILTIKKCEAGHVTNA